MEVLILSPHFPHKITSSSPPQSHHNFQISCYKPKQINFRSTLEIPKPHPLLTSFFTSADAFICDFLDAPLRHSVDPSHHLSGNFAPVSELPPTACEVELGPLPPCLDGAYIRNGPNPQFPHRGPYHPFDGDGMLHAVTISGGRAVFCSRFVRTYKYQLEKEARGPVVLNSFSSFNGLPASLARSVVAVGRILSGQYDLRRGTGTANTSVAYFGGKLFAISESDLPYSIKLTPDGDIITLGRYEVLGEAVASVTAHPKVDPQTGEAFVYSHGVRRPYLTYFRVNRDGTKQQPDVQIFSKTQPSLVHDLAITQNYAVLPDTQIAIRLSEILKGNPMIAVDSAKSPRLGIIPRYAADDSEMLWIDTLGFNMLHTVNAWDDDGGDTVVLVASNLLPVEHFLENVEQLHTLIERIEIDMKTKTVVRRSPLSAQWLELPSINPAYVGKKNRYLYAALQTPMPKASGVVKLDLSVPETGDCTVARRLYEPGCYGGEPFFVAKEAAEEEDDGYLMTYMHNERTQESRLVVMDAKSPNLEIVAAVKLPRRVPYGYHGIFLRREDLTKLY